MKDIEIDFYADTFRKVTLQVDYVEMKKLSVYKRTEIICDYIQKLLRRELGIYTKVEVITWRWL